MRVLMSLKSTNCNKHYLALCYPMGTSRIIKVLVFRKMVTIINKNNIPNFFQSITLSSQIWWDSLIWRGYLQTFHPHWILRRGLWTKGNFRDLLLAWVLIIWKVIHMEFKWLSNLENASHRRGLKFSLLPLNTKEQRVGPWRGLLLVKRLQHFIQETSHHSKYDLCKINPDNVAEPKEKY